MVLSEMCLKYAESEVAVNIIEADVSSREKREAMCLLSPGCFVTWTNYFMELEALESGLIKAKDEKSGDFAF